MIVKIFETKLSVLGEINLNQTSVKGNTTKDRKSIKQANTLPSSSYLQDTDIHSFID